MAANLNDGLALLHKFLIEHATVSGLIDGGTAVYLAYPRDPTPGEVRLPAVVIQMEGGEPWGASVQLVQCLVTIWCFSRTGVNEAGALHHAVVEAIQRQHIRSTVTLAGGSLAAPGAVGCDIQGGIKDTWNETLQAWARSSRWLLTIV